MIREPIRLLALCNWGLGLEIVRALHGREDVCLCAVGTAADERDGDRWRNAVRDWCVEQGVEVLDTDALSDRELAAWVAGQRIDLMLCHSHMRYIPEFLFTAPERGTVNVHPSLLPKYRGPSPTDWVLKNGDSETGLTAHFVDEGMDTGDIICSRKVAVRPGDTRQAVIEALKGAVPGLVDEIFACLGDPSFRPRPQDHTQASHAPRM